MNPLDQVARSGDAIVAEFIEFCRPVPDVVSLQDYEDAISLLTVRLESAWVGGYGKDWVQHAIAHLKAKIDGYLRDTKVPRDQQQFMAMLKTLAHGYQEGAQALDWAARRLKDKHHDLHGASETHKAAVSMAKAAQELIGEE